MAKDTIENLAKQVLNLIKKCDFCDTQVASVRAGRIVEPGKNEYRAVFTFRITTENKRKAFWDYLSRKDYSNYMKFELHKFAVDNKLWVLYLIEKEGMPSEQKDALELHLRELKSDLENYLIKKQ